MKLAAWVCVVWYRHVNSAHPHPPIHPSAVFGIDVDVFPQSAQIQFAMSKSVAPPKPLKAAQAEESQTVDKSLE